jgi:hypothetical protein
VILLIGMIGKTSPATTANSELLGIALSQLDMLI